jgi:DNA modification methylase
VTAIVTRGDAAHLHLPDESVDLIVTSPPYYSLRSYLDDGQHYEGQVGDEDSPGEYLDALIACTREWVRVLKPGGSLFVNLGDKYAGSNGVGGGLSSSTLDGAGRAHAATHTGATASRRRRAATGAPPKSLIGLPWRYALRCVDELGLILRAEIVWSKPNGLPESVTDRVRRSHEQVFHLTKRPRYFAAVDEVREGYEGKPQRRFSPRSVDKAPRQSGPPRTAEDYVWTEPQSGVNPLGRLPGSVWEIATAPLKVPDELGVDHFAAYPPELVKRIVSGWSPREVCTACGEGRRPVTTFTGEQGRTPGGQHRADVRTYANLSTASLRARAVSGYVCACTPYVDHPGSGDSGAGYGESLGAGAYVTSDKRDEWGSNSLQDRPRVGAWREYLFDDWTPPPTTRGVVLDPFGGTGTTALVASCFGRVGISVDLSLDYCRLAAWRTSDPGELARVLEVPKPPTQVDGQLSLLEGLGLDLEPVPKVRRSSSLQGGRERDCTSCGYRTQYSNRRNCEACGAERTAS